VLTSGVSGQQNPWRERVCGGSLRPLAGRLLEDQVAEPRHSKGSIVEPYVTVDNIEIKAQAWLERILPYNRHDMQMNVAASALLVIDMQRFFLDATSPTFTCGGLAILPTVKRLVEAFRRAGRPVIFTRHVHHPGDLDSGIMRWWWEGKCLEGSPESEIDPALAPLRSEKVVFKHRYSAFYDTDLQTVLRCLKVEDLVVSGIMTNLCCESTARDAYYRDYRVFVPADGTGTISEEMQLASLLNLAFGFAFVTTGERIVAQLSRSLPSGRRQESKRDG
jgi:nicotinamidase-related amidase